MKVETSELKRNSSLKLMLTAAQQSAFDFEIKNCVNSIWIKFKPNYVQRIVEHA